MKNRKKKIVIVVAFIIFIIGLIYLYICKITFDRTYNEIHNYNDENPLLTEVHYGGQPSTKVRMLLIRKKKCIK